ncbi:c-type cytochrome [Leptospira bourretii]|uniref:Cytochrome c domain-containing protein n=1 Tax=Leptospira bourretii TaxID=2484962 RepID=A0ABY2LJK7_9LEPT|nr:hypothetical protein [Leptospira bourretii]TGK92221.1 hypothetical protein EHQ26_09600 [Leptospira bourretii]TGL26310.1 hypothetical protein EHQ45_20105 [Leptospira bourretii]
MIAKDKIKKYIIFCILISTNYIKAQESPEFEIGLELMDKYSCSLCHSLFDKRRLVGPSLKGIYKTNRKLTNNEVKVADENYLKDAIINRNRATVSGFQDNLHPKYTFTEEELKILVSTIKNL